MCADSNSMCYAAALFFLHCVWSTMYVHIDRSTFLIIYHWSCYWISSQVVNVVVVCPMQFFFFSILFRCVFSSCSLRMTKMQIIHCRNMADKICLNRMKVSHLPSGTSVSRLITHKRYFAGGCTLL